MSEVFVRCYIGDISLSTLKNVQRESGKFDEWELMQGSEFKLKESYGYRGGIGKQQELLLDALAKRSVIAETRQPERVKTSLIWNNVLNLADVITLLSLARACHYPTLAVERGKEDGYSIAWGVMTREEAGNRDIVSISNLGQFISEALTYIENNSSLLIESGFKPSIFWYQQAQQAYSTAPTIMEIALYWVSLEIVASIYIKNSKINTSGKAQKVRRFLKDRGYTGQEWRFLSKVIRDCYAIRNNAFHEGIGTLPPEVMLTRRGQIRELVSLVLVEMLQQQEEARKTEIAVKMQSY